MTLIAGNRASKILMNLFVNLFFDSEFIYYIFNYPYDLVDHMWKSVHDKFWYSERLYAAAIVDRLETAMEQNVNAGLRMFRNVKILWWILFLYVNSFGLKWERIWKWVNGHPLQNAPCWNVLIQNVISLTLLYVNKLFWYLCITNLTGSLSVLLLTKYI